MKRKPTFRWSPRACLTSPCECHRIASRALMKCRVAHRGARENRFSRPSPTSGARPRGLDGRVDRILTRAYRLAASNRRSSTSPSTLMSTAPGGLPLNRCSHWSEVVSNAAGRPDFRSRARSTFATTAHAWPDLSRAGLRVPADVSQRMDRRAQGASRHSGAEEDLRRGAIDCRPAAAGEYVQPTDAGATSRSAARCFPYSRHRRHWRGPHLRKLHR